jgi:DNA (cytosine-5)-methyltransferase 1|tara:strand:+ start:160 stop:993 length:834 start_codon:yes stop_codon:yes gene_type:complete
MRKLRTLDLFAGIGGFSLGLHRTGGFETVAFVERDDYAQKVLAKNFLDVPIFDDVRTFDADGLGRIDVITGGFPCQPWSVAGKREGHLDTQDRDLWPKMASIIEELQPKWVIGENVQGFVNEPMGLARTLADLESIGYQSTYWILPAAGVGAPHRRNRVFILAHTRHGRRGDIRVTEKGQYPQRERSTNTDSVSGSSKQPLLVAHTDSPLSERNERAKRSEQERANNSQLSRWATEPDICRVAHGIPRRVDRLRCLGNAIVPQIATQIGNAILEAEK